MKKHANSVKLIGYYGGDITHSCSAWTSTSRKLTPEKRARIPKLLKDLAEAGHETPFEKSALHFLITTDIATHIQLLKHRISVSVNTESARYKELKEDKFYLPDDWSTHGDAKAAEWYKRLQDFNTQSNQLYHDCLADLTPILGRKRAKESARYFKPYSSQIQADVQFNFRSFVHFQRLRGALDSGQHAQLEIRQVALDMLSAVRAIRRNGACPFEYSLVAFGL